MISDSEQFSGPFETINAVKSEHLVLDINQVNAETSS